MTIMSAGYITQGRPALGHTLNILVAILASALSGFVIYANELLPTTLINKLEFDAIKQQLSYSYFATYQHVGPYCLGLLTGYLLHKRPHMRLPKYLTWLLWLLLPPLSFTTLLLTYLWNGAYQEPGLLNPSPLVSALYVAIHRTIWSSLVAWLVFACTTGRARLLNQLLSHSIFVPVSRLSYSIYLVHLPVIMFRSLNLRHTVEWTDQNILYEACGNFVASLFMGYFLNVAFESPIINLENYLSAGCRRERATTSATPSQTLHFAQSAGHKLQSDSDCSSSTAGSTDGGGGGGGLDPNNSIGREHLASGRLSTTTTRAGRGPFEMTGQRKSLQPKQASSVERIFGQLQAPPPDQQRGAADFVAGSSSASAVSSNDLATTSEHTNPTLAPTRPQEGREFSPVRQADFSVDDNEQDSQQQQQRRRQHQRNRLAYEQSIDEGRLLSAWGADPARSNFYDEYQHYAPGGYKRWRMYMNNNGTQVAQGGLSHSRPMHYATLARTSRLSQRDRLLLQQEQRQRLQPHDTGHYANTSQSLADHNDELGQDYNDDHDGAGGWRSRRYLVEAAAAAAPPSRAHAGGRYNTLTGTRLRDLRSHYNNHHQSAPPSDGDERAGWPESLVGGAHRRAGAAGDETLWAGGLPTLWRLQQSPMIPRVNSSTLRRQSHRLAESTGAGSIVEETPNLDHNRDHGEQEVGRQKSAL